VQRHGGPSFVERGATLSPAATRPEVPGFRPGFATSIGYAGEPTSGWPLTSTEINLAHLLKSMRDCVLALFGCPGNLLF
jgi:hypothetical protein